MAWVRDPQLVPVVNPRYYLGSHYCVKFIHVQPTRPQYHIIPPCRWCFSAFFTFEYRRYICKCTVYEELTHS